MVATPDAASSEVIAPVDRSGVGDRRRRRRAPSSSTAARATARVCGAIIAAGAVIWLSVSVGVRRLDSSLFLRPVVLHMMAGEPYAPAVVAALDADMSLVLSDAVCDYQALQDLAVVRSALAEIAFQGEDADLADRRLTAAEAAAKASIACSPGSPRAWTILAWIEHIRHEDTPLLRTYLRKSYQSGPYEGWSLVRRMEILLVLYPKLDDAELADLKQSVNWLVVKQMSDFIGEHYISAKPDQRAILRDILAEAPERAQKRAAEIIRNGGEDIDLPMVEPLGTRPWK